MRIPEEDDSHKRWEKQTGHAQKVWEHYNTVIAPTIIRGAIRSALLRKSIVNLIDLYQVLSVARFRCEFEKTYATVSDLQFVRDFAFRSDFGMSTDLQCSCEPNIFFEAQWGEMAKALARCRVNYSGHLDCGLSVVNCDRNAPGRDSAMLTHPGGQILSRLNLEFQKLIATPDFFEFVTLSARLMYNLSNFPPVIRGSASINTWLIEVIAQERFGILCGIRPLLSDWTAFYETSEQYTGFFVLSAIANYLKTIPDYYKEHKKFLDSIPHLMMDDPSYLDNLGKREAAWGKMKADVAQALNNLALTSDQRKYLTSICNGILQFRKPSDEIIKLADNLAKRAPKQLTREVLQDCISASGYTEAKLNDIISFVRNRASLYLQSYGNEIEESKLNLVWVEFSVLAQLEPRSILALNNLLSIPAIKTEKEKTPYGVISLSFDPTSLSREILQQTLKSKCSFVIYQDNLYYVDTDWIPQKVISPYYAYNIAHYNQQPSSGHYTDLSRKEVDAWLSSNFRPARFSVMIEIFRKMSLATQEDIAALPIETITLLADENPDADTSEMGPLKQRLQKAILSGGVKLQDLIGLNMEQIKIIASPEAIVLYQQNNFIRGLEILSDSKLDHSETSNAASSVSAHDQGAEKNESIEMLSLKHRSDLRNFPVSEQEMVERFLRQYGNTGVWENRFFPEVTIQKIVEYAKTENQASFFQQTGNTTRKALSDLGVKFTDKDQITEDSVKSAINAKIAEEKEAAAASQKNPR